MADKNIFIRNFDQETYHRARMAALKAGIPIGEWITQVVKEKLSRKKATQPTKE